MAARPISPMKLPSYRLPAIVRACTPSPPPTSGSINNTLIAPLGCELIIREIIPTQMHSTVSQVKAAVDNIQSMNNDLSTFPIKIDGSSGKETLSTFCYIRLSDSVSRMAVIPRPDLLWLWAEAIQSAKPEWSIGWSPQPRKDKKLWVRIAEMGEVTKESRDKLQAVEKECIARGYTILSIFSMTNSVGVILAQTKHATELINEGITVPSISPHPLPTFSFRQIEPVWAFELVISGISCYDFGLVQSLDQYMTHTFRDDSGLLFHASCTIDDYYCFVMRDWPATKLVLLKADAIENDFARQSLS